MMKFIKKNLLFCSGLFIFFIVIESLYRNIPNTYYNKYHFYLTKGETISVLFLGSSHIGTGINPYLLKYDSFNGAMGGQLLSYDCAIYEKYSQYLTNTKYVVVAIDYQSFTKGHEFGQIHKPEYAIFLGINLDKSLVNYSSILSRGLRTTLTDIINYYVLSEPEHVQYYEKGNLKSKIRQLSGEQLLKDSKEKLKRDIQSSRKNYQENLVAIKKIVSLTQNQGKKLVLITNPTSYDYTKGANRIQLKNIENIGKRLSEEYVHVYYHSYFGDNDFYDKDFYDADHLNEYGARKLTLKVDSLIRVIDNKFKFLK